MAVSDKGYVMTTLAELLKLCVYGRQGMLRRVGARFSEERERLFHPLLVPLTQFLRRRFGAEEKRTVNTPTQSRK